MSKRTIVVIGWVETVKVSSSSVTVQVNQGYTSGGNERPVIAFEMSHYELAEMIRGFNDAARKMIAAHQSEIDYLTAILPSADGGEGSGA